MRIVSSESLPFSVELRPASQDKKGTGNGTVVQTTKNGKDGQGKNKQNTEVSKETF